MTRLASVTLVLLLGAGGRADDDVPLVGRPSGVPFSGASGDFRMAVNASPTDLEAEDPLTLTLTVRANGPVYLPPQRPDLREVPGFADRFYLETPPEPERRPDLDTWEFVYRLRPRNPDVKAVPSVPFVYYHRDIPWDNRRFMTQYSDPIPLTVRPREVVKVPLTAPDCVLGFTSGDDVLTHSEPWHPPTPLALSLWLGLPPAGCAVWYAVWRRLYPDAARLARQRRSRAARVALAALRSLPRVPVGRRPEVAANAVANYVTHRIDRLSAEPTPDEVARVLGNAGLDPELVARVVELFRRCDAGRFTAASDMGVDESLKADAEAIILALEAATCPEQPS